MQSITSAFLTLALLPMFEVTTKAAFELEVGSGRVYYSFSSEAAQLMPGAKVIETEGPVRWSGGSVKVAVSSNPEPGNDHIGIRTTGFGATEIRVENAGPSVEIKYGGVTFATAVGFMPGTNLTSSGELTCVFQSVATTAAVEALLNALIFRRDSFGYAIFEANLLAVVPGLTVQLALSDGKGDSVSKETEINFPRVIGLRCSPRILYAVAGGGQTGDMVVFADFDSGSQLARIRPQLSFEAEQGSAVVEEGRLPHTVYFTIPPTTTAEIIPIQVYVTKAPEIRTQVCINLNSDKWSILQLLSLMRDECFGSEGSRLGQLISAANYAALRELMLRTSEGLRLNQLYARHSKELTTIVSRQQQLLPEFQNLVISWQPLVNGLLAGRGTNVINANMVNRLNTLWDFVLSFASPALKADMTAERERFNHFQAFTNKTLVQWAQMLELAVPTNSFIQLSKPRLTNGQFSAEANYTDGIHYGLEAGTTLSNWLSVTTLKLRTNNNLSIELIDTNAPRTGTFYRATAR